LLVATSKSEEMATMKQLIVSILNRNNSEWVHFCAFVVKYIRNEKHNENQNQNECLAPHLQS
jgi:hypothetical protein